MTTHQDNPFFRRFSITLITAWLAVFVLLPTLMVTGTSVLTRDDSHFVSLAADAVRLRAPV
jgi:hypothetical protein